MSFFSDLFKSKKQETVRTRQDMENSLTVIEGEERHTTTSRGVLSRIFKHERPSREEERKTLREVFDLMSSVPQGKKLLDDVTKAGYEIFFEAFKSDSFGCMYGDKKKIVLSTAKHENVAGMAMSLLHEMTHAVQNERSEMFSDKRAQYVLADQFKFWRASEAAACAEEAKFAYQIKDRHPEIEKFAEKFPMYPAFKAEMEKSGDMAKAGEAAFKAWYGFKEYQESYEEDHVHIFSYSLKSDGVGNRAKLTKSFPSAEVLQKVFISDDIGKNISADYLTSKEAFSVSEEAVQKLDKLLDSLGKKGKDMSMHSMYSVGTEKTYSEVHSQSAENAAASHCPKSSGKTSTQTDKVKQAAFIQARGRMTQR